MNFVVLGAGSNKTWNGLSCVRLLKKAWNSLTPLLSDMKSSCVYRTKPMYVKNQDDFFNMVFSGYVQDSVSPGVLLREIHRIEESLGRDRSKETRNGPRTLDIDIEIFGDARVDTPELQIPHPRIKERGFVLVPLLEILDESADFKSKDEFVDAGKNCDFSGVEKFMSVQDFLSIEV